MSVFEGVFRPPAAAPTVSVVSIGGPGRCEITSETMVFEGFKSSVSLKTFAIALAAGAVAALGAILFDEIGALNLDVKTILAEAMFVMVGMGVLLHQRSDRNRPVRYEVKLSGVKQVRPISTDASTLLIEAPGIRHKAAIFFRPTAGTAAFLEAYRQARPGA